jgi:hypothetical protein
LYCQRQFQSHRKAANQIDSDTPDFALALPDGEEGGCGWSGNDAAAKLASGRKLPDVVGVGHGDSI